MKEEDTSTSLDFSGINVFWKIMGKLEREEYPTEAEWAFLQSYEEVDENVNTNILTIDNERGNQYSVPFYSASQLSPWSGRYTDPPLDNIPAGGSLCYLCAR